MRCLYLLNLLIVGIAAHLSSPVDDADVSDLIATNRVVARPAGRRLGGPAALAKAYAKYKKPLPDSVEAGLALALASSLSSSALASGTQTGTLPGQTVEPNDAEYLFPVTVGSNTLNIDFDTGSADFWVYSTQVKPRLRASHNLYDPSKSGALWANQSWRILYGSGDSANGNIWNDTVKLGNITLKQQNVEAAEKVSSYFVNSTIDGILGLSFDAESQCRPELCTTPFSHMQPSLAAPLFTATLRHQQPGEFDFGFIDHSKYTGRLTTIPQEGDPLVLGYSTWTFQPSGFAIGNGSEFKLGYQPDRFAIADTGTALLVLDPRIVRRYYALVPGAHYHYNKGGWVFPCNETSQLPSLSVFIGGVKHTTPGAFMRFETLENGACYGGLQSNVGFGFAILGDVFLKSQFVVFNAGERTMGFAHQAGVEL